MTYRSISAGYIAVVTHLTESDSSFFYGQIFFSPGFAPKIEIETSTFGDDWYRMLQDPKHCDVTFVLEDKHRLDAHKLVLCSSSKVFAKIFGISKPVKVNISKY